MSLLHFSLLLWGATVTLLYVIYISTPVELITNVSHLKLNFKNPHQITKSMKNGTEKNLTEIVLSPDQNGTTRTIYKAGHLNVNLDICPELGKNVQLLVVVTSAPRNQPERMAIRQTWGHYGSRIDVSIIFMLGFTSDQKLKDQLRQEEYLYGDIVTGKFVDTYENLTLKTISMLEYVYNYCKSADFVLKTDDDMFINVPLLLAFINQQKPERRSIYGRVAKQWEPFRDIKSKYYISPQDFKFDTFPDFTTGPAYLFPAMLAKELYTAALNHKYFKLEDVFLTGIVADSLKIQRVHDPQFVNERASLSACSVRKRITTHQITCAEQYRLWQNLLDGVAKCR